MGQRCCHECSNLFENNIITAVYDKECGGIVSLKSAYDDFKADFVLTPEEFPEYDVDDCKWLGNLEGKIVLGKETVSFSTGRLKKERPVFLSGKLPGYYLAGNRKRRKKTGFFHGDAVPS